MVLEEKLVIEQEIRLLSEKTFAEMKLLNFKGLMLFFQLQSPVRF